MNPKIDACSRVFSTSSRDMLQGTYIELAISYQELFAPTPLQHGNGSAFLQGDFSVAEIASNDSTIDNRKKREIWRDESYELLVWQVQELLDTSWLDRSSAPKLLITFEYTSSETGSGSGWSIRAVPDMLMYRLKRGSLVWRSKFPETR
jgi:hypothetical protein